MYSCHQDPNDIQRDIENIIEGVELKACPRSNRKVAFLAVSNTTKAENHNSTDGFVNAGLLIAVFVALALSILFATISMVQTMVLIFYSSPYSILNVFGLYMWNIVAFLFTILTLILYGSLFASSLINNIAIADTLNQPTKYSSEGLAKLGFSYWILFVPICMHFVNLGLLKYRTILMNRSEPLPVLRIDRSDTNLMVY
jgi:hypothetical protein